MVMRYNVKITTRFPEQVKLVELILAESPDGSLVLYSEAEAELAVVKAERDAAVERGERLEWLVEVQDLALVMVEECNNGPWNPSYMELRASYKAARAAVEGK